MPVRVAMSACLMSAAPAVCAAGADQLRKQLFDDHCVGRTAEQSERASEQVGSPTVNTFGGGQRYLNFPVKSAERAVVPGIINTATGLQCSAGVNHVGYLLYEEGRSAGL
ncbi:hypothetical protein [uncultured Tateyamaria sp.]|uniref:hypothetical protein n=1 Tax=uncultured Tateyamaria sp. TaxID=455651 RepID=UPI002615F15A|nr:hypothetical protein [uncultured Tateyamaria sp.]